MKKVIVLCVAALMGGCASAPSVDLEKESSCYLSSYRFIQGAAGAITDDKAIEALAKPYLEGKVMRGGDQWVFTSPSCEQAASIGAAHALQKHKNLTGGEVAVYYLSIKDRFDEVIKNKL